jgi:hypothetical protein
MLVPALGIAAISLIAAAVKKRGDNAPVPVDVAATIQRSLQSGSFDTVNTLATALKAQYPAAAKALTDCMLAAQATGFYRADVLATYQAVMKIASAKEMKTTAAAMGTKQPYLAALLRRMANILAVLDSKAAGLS